MSLAKVLFKTRKHLTDHYKKHGEGHDSPEEYLRRANEVLSTGHPQIAKRGTIRVYRPDTQEHVIYDPTVQKLLTYYVRKAILDV